MGGYTIISRVARALFSVIPEWIAAAHAAQRHWGEYHLRDFITQNAFLASKQLVLQVETLLSIIFSGSVANFTSSSSRSKAVCAFYVYVGVRVYISLCVWKDQAITLYNLNSESSIEPVRGVCATSTPTTTSMSTTSQPSFSSPGALLKPIGSYARPITHHHPLYGFDLSSPVL